MLFQWGWRQFQTIIFFLPYYNSCLKWSLLHLPTDVHHLVLFRKFYFQSKNDKYIILPWFILVRSDNKQYDCPHQTNTSCVWYSDNSKDRLRWNMPYSMGILVSNEITKDQVITTFVQDTESIGMSLHAIVWQWTNLTLTELRKHQVLYPRKLLMLLEKTERI